MAFAHDIAGGQGNLIAASVQSPDFLTGVRGWQVRRDGSAELNNVTIRGTIIASVFQGTNFEIDQDGAFFYDPVSLNLVASIAAQSGTNRFGDPYLQGVTAYYVTPGFVRYALQMSASGGFVPLTWSVYAGGGTWTTVAQVASIGASGLNLDSSASGDLTLNAGAHSIILDSAVSALGPVTATAGTPSAPTLITTDGWQTGGLGTGWTAGNGVGGVFWRLLSTGDVLLAWDIETATSGNANTIVTLGSAYRPATTVQLHCGHASGAPAAYTPGFAPSLKLSTGGLLTAQGIPSLSGTIELFGTAIVPLGAL